MNPQLERPCSRENGASRRHFILLSTARSGSTLLMDLMNNHPEVKCLHEPLNRERLDEKQLIGASKEEILQHVKTVMAEVDEPVVGMKLFLEHLQDNGLKIGDFIELLDNPKVIVLYRPNQLDTFVSLTIAYANNRWYSTKERNTEAVEVKWEDFRGYSTEWRRLWESAVADVKHLLGADDRAIVTYDELCANKDDVTQRMFRLLNVWEIDYGIRHYSVKQNPVNLEDKIANFAEISAFISSESELVTLSL